MKNKGSFLYLGTITVLTSVMIGLVTASNQTLSGQHVGAAENISSVNHEQYVTVSKSNAVSYASFNWSRQAAGDALYHKTFRTTVSYRNANGNTYLSIWDNRGKWFGYINKKDVLLAPGPQGSWLAAKEYATLKKANQPIYQGFQGKVISNSSNYLGKTYKVTGEYHLYNGQVYKSLYAYNGTGIGYMTEDSLTLTNVPQGSWESKTGWVSINPGGVIWNGFSFSKSQPSNKYKVLKVNGQYQHVNGSTYYSLYDGNNKWVGYINSKSTVSSTQPKDEPMADHRYVTVNSQNARIFSDFQWHQTQSGNALYGNTYQTDGKYKHANGYTYLKLIDGTGHFVGYINQGYVTTAPGPQGRFVDTKLYTTFRDNGITYGDLDLTKEMSSGAQLGTATYKIAGMYKSITGRTVYSLYSGSNKSVGYVDAAKVKTTSNQAGLWLAKTGYLTITKKDQPISSSLNFNHHGTTNSHYHNTYKVNGEYKTYGGETYYSLYDVKNQWVGYLNSNAGTLVAYKQGIWLPHSGKLQVTVKSYPIWKDFNGHQSTTTDAHYQQVFSATGEYHHFDGSVYLALYDDGKPIGYLNADATKPWLSWQSRNGSLRHIDDHTFKQLGTFNIKYYSQLDSRWAHYRYERWTLGDTACGQAVMAMIISGFGKNVTPKMTADYSYAHGDFDRGTSGSLQSDLTLDADHWGLTWKVMSSKTELASYLAKGYPASVCLDFGTYRHIVALTGYSNGYTTVHDPWSGLIYSGRKSLSDIWSRLSWMHGNRNKGASAAVVYVAK